MKIVDNWTSVSSNSTSSNAPLSGQNRKRENDHDAKSASVIKFVDDCAVLGDTNSENNEKIKKLDESFRKLESEIESLAIEAIAHAGDEKKLTLWVPVTKPCFDKMQSAVLDKLVLHHCSRLKNKDFNDFNKFKNLRVLTLNKCNNEKLTEMFVDKLPKDSLEILQIDRLAKVTDNLLGYLPNKKLYALSLHTSGPKEFTNEKMGNFPKTITSLTLYKVNDLNEVGIKNLAKNNPNLDHLNLSGSKNIRNEALPCFPTKLNGLYLHGCSIEETPNLSSLKQLIRLGIGNWNCPKHSLIDALPDYIKLRVCNEKEKNAYEEIIKQKERTIEVCNVGDHRKFE